MYVHVPFCATPLRLLRLRHLGGPAPPRRAYAEACLTELASRLRRRARPCGHGLFGGGTPSQLPGDELARLLDAVRPLEGAEVTVECNPEDVTVGLLSHLRRAPV